MLTVIGEALVDLVDAGDGRTFSAHPGGSPYNVAIGLAKLGHPTTLVAGCGSDPFGRRLRENAERWGVAVAPTEPAAEPSSLAVASLDAVGRAAYAFYLDGTASGRWRAADVAAGPSQTTFLHTGSLSAWLPAGADVIHGQVLRSAAAGAVISYDPNVRPALLGEAGPYSDRGRAVVERSVAAAHVVKASDEDLEWLYPGQDADEVAGRWLGLGADLVVVTRGAAGASGYGRAAGAVHRPAPKIALVDTVGAGDAFMSGLLGAMADLTASPEAVAGWPAPRIAAILAESVLVAAMTCERAGANPPTRAELDRRHG
jgi:fructokinase